jgi:hypothetical protein
LRQRYAVTFEAFLSAKTSLDNYEYLGLLDELFDAAPLEVPRGGRVCDAGCASFWYVAALQVFFRPSELCGVEIEGYRRLRGGHSRNDHALGFIERWPATQFVVADYKGYLWTADVITCWFPFVSPAPLLGARLPLSLLAPQAWFGQVKRNLRPGGILVMANHGTTEAHLAAGYCQAAGLQKSCEWIGSGALRPRSRPAAMSIWTHA